MYKNKLIYIQTGPSMPKISNISIDHLITPSPNWPCVKYDDLETTNNVSR